MGAFLIFGTRKRRFTCVFAMIFFIKVGFESGERNGKKRLKGEYATSFKVLYGFRCDCEEGVWYDYLVDIKKL